MQHNHQRKELPLYIVENKEPALLGREWPHEIQTDWKNRASLNRLARPQDMSAEWKPKLDALLDKHSDLFKDELGTIRGEQAELIFRDGVQPKFLKARSVPYAIQAACDAQLTEMEKHEIIAPVATSESATPVVPVVKEGWHYPRVR